MPPRRRVTRSKKRTEPEVIPDMGSAQMEPQEADSPPRMRQRVSEQEEFAPTQDLNSEFRWMRQEMEKLKAENQVLREEIARNKTPAVQTPHLSPTFVSRRVARRMIDEEGVSIHDFLKLRTPEFNGEEGDDPQEFLEETEKMIRRLPCSDARVIELVGIMMKKNAWDWFQRNIEDQLYGGNPPSWEEFKKLVMDEFLAPAERQNRALQFERLKQMPGVSVTEYAKEFIRLSKYALHIVPTEHARVERFKSGLIAPIYNAMLATEFSTLSRLIDKAKQWETRNKEERAEKEQRKKNQMKGEKTIYSAPPKQYMKEINMNESQSIMISSAPRPSYSMNKSNSRPICMNCGRKHVGECRMGQEGCFRCGQLDHYMKNCPQIIGQQVAPPTSHTTVQMPEPGKGGAGGRGRPSAPSQTQSVVPAQSQIPIGRGQGRVFTLNPSEA